MNEYTLTDTDNKIYRWIPLEICLKNLIRGLSFGRASNYKDKTEFTAAYRPLQREDVIEFLEGKNPKDDSAIEAWTNASEEEASLRINELESQHNPEVLRKALDERFFTCCFTKEFSKNFKWSDQTNDPKVCLVINRDIFYHDHRNLVRPVKYVDQRPILRLPDSYLLEVVYEIIFTKLKTDGKYNYENEKEIRAILCKDVLMCPEEAVLHEVEDGTYAYEKNLHEYLEAILFPTETLDLEVVKETKLKIEQELKASRDIEKQISLCKELWQMSNDPRVSQSVIFHEMAKRAGMMSPQENLRKMQQVYNALNVYQKHSTIMEMLSVLDEGVNVDSRLEELAKRPKYGDVQLYKV